MVAFDYLLVAVVAVSVGFGLLRGFLREAFSLASWIAAAWLAWKSAPSLASVFSFDPPVARLWLARVLVFVAVVALGALAGHLLGAVVRRSPLSGADRALGALFGFARGVLLLALVVVAAQALAAPRAPWWTQSKLAPWGLAVAAWGAAVLDLEQGQEDRESVS
ncbi:hypothetical protein BH24PSE2_BH24PSE2_03450 [soil metagenome]